MKKKIKNKLDKELQERITFLKETIKKGVNGNELFIISNELIIYLIARQTEENNKDMIKVIIDFKDFFKKLINKNIKQKQIKEATKNEQDKTTFKNFKNNNFL